MSCECYCSVALPHGAVGWYMYAVCDCGNSWSYSFTFYTPAYFVCGGYTVFTLSVRESVRACMHPSITFCLRNILKSHCLFFIKFCKHVHICKTNTLDKKVRARVQFY